MQKEDYMKQEKLYGMLKQAKVDLKLGRGLFGTPGA
jgi:hypothetical protein